MSERPSFFPKIAKRLSVREAYGYQRASELEERGDMEDDVKKLMAIAYISQAEKAEKFHGEMAKLMLGTGVVLAVLGAIDETIKLTGQGRFFALESGIVSVFAVGLMLSAVVPFLRESSVKEDVGDLKAFRVS